MSSSFGLPLIIASALLIIGLERLYPYDPGQRVLRDGFWVDLLGYGVLQSYLLGLAIAGLIGWLDGLTGWSRLRLVSDWPLAAQCAFFFVVHDLYIYLFHRLQHHSRWLWRIHEAHHSGRAVDWLSGTRSHALEIMINQTVEFAPIVLLGAAPEVAVFKGVIDAVWGMFIHANLDVRLGLFAYVFNGPELHRVHHAREFRGSGRNFATKLAIWDWLLGTAHLPADKPDGYGLAGAAEFPRGFVAQQLYAFRRARQSGTAATLPRTCAVGCCGRMPVRTKRWNDPVEPEDGFRLLICRYRPRGVRKQAEPWQASCPALAPSAELHAAVYGKTGPAIGWDEYARRFREEMAGAGYFIQSFAERVRQGETLTLLCSSACTDPARCHRSIVKELIERAAGLADARSPQLRRRKP